MSVRPPIWAGPCQTKLQFARCLHSYVHRNIADIAIFHWQRNRFVADLLAAAQGPPALRLKAMKAMKAVKKSKRGPPFKAEKERKPRASGRHAKRSRLRLPTDSRQRPYRVEWEGFDAWGGQAPTTADGRVIELTPGVRVFVDTGHRTVFFKE